MSRLKASIPPSALATMCLRCMRISSRQTSQTIRVLVVTLRTATRWMGGLGSRGPFHVMSRARSCRRTVNLYEHGTPTGRP